jgi:hypothetical protein
MADRVKRFLSLLAICIVPLLAGCKDPAPAADSPASGFVHAGTDIVIKSVRTFSPSDQVAGTNDEYYVATFTFTNNQGMTLAPRIDHFVIQDLQNRRFLGADSGNVNLIGISNYTGTLKVGDSHDYTVGFRVPINTNGTLFYDNTF